MFFEERCECNECRRNRRVRRCEEVKRENNFECGKEFNFNRRKLNGLREGDRIQVFSGGDKIDKTGVFINIEDGFLVWVDHHANINVTSLNVISVRRIS